MPFIRLLAAALVFTSGAALADEALLITGAGATFPAPLYTKWFDEYNKLHPEVRINYQAIGSGGGIQQITNGTVDFGASDAPLLDEELARIPDAVHIPTTMGSVVVTWNGPFGELRLSPEVLSGIFLGKISRWNDPAIADTNPGAPLPDAAIHVIHRADGSGTTSIFTDYLSKVSPEWKEKVGAGKSVRWPTGLGAKGNDGVTGLVKQNPGAIGYVELAFARQNKLPMATLRNRHGAWVRPSVEATSAAAAGAAIPADYRVSITDAEGKTAYPMASFTYLLVHRDLGGDAAKGKALVQFLWWALHEGERFEVPLDYAPLPKPVAERVFKTIQGLTVKGAPVPLAAAK
jgi:phosphate transport system substrate-binding protein